LGLWYVCLLVWYQTFANKPNQYESCNNQTSDALDAYARAAELDPTNTHIKARLQLLRSGGATGPNQHSAPVPQDVHPQAYQNGVGVPPGPQWGVQSTQNQQPSQPPVDPARVQDWTRGIAGIQQPPQPTMPQPNGFDNRDAMRAPPPRMPSPRQEPPRGYPESARQTPSRKVHSPSPKLQPAMPGMYPPAPHHQQQPSLPQLGMQDRGPNFGSGIRPSPIMNPAPGNSVNSAASSSTLPPYGRPFSPPTELRPIRDDGPTSPGTPYHHQPFQSAQPFPSMNSGPPPASTPLPSVVDATGARDERPPSAMKRAREWEADGPSKKAANDETRARLEDHSMRRASPPGRMPTPRDHYRRSSSEVRRENERRATENYHPSAAAHHPYSLPPQQIPSMQTILDGAKEDRKEIAEPAARKVEVDEDYDNNSEDDKRAGAPAPVRTSPMQNGASSMPKQETAA